MDSQVRRVYLLNIYFLYIIMLKFFISSETYVNLRANMDNKIHLLPLNGS